MRRFVILVFVLAVFLMSVFADSPARAAVTSYAVGEDPRGMCTADFDGDGVPDLATANLETDDISVLIGIGDGSFEAAVSYAVGTEPSGVCAADVNNDTHIDLAVANFMSDNVSILLNNGDGTFAAAVNYSAGVTGNGPRGIIAAELNGAGFIDLAVTNLWGDSVAVLINNDDGTFPTYDTYNMGLNSEPFGIFSADFDNDGFGDLVVTNSGLDSNNIGILLNNGDGTFAAPVNYATGESPRSVRSADLDGNGSPDLAVANYSTHNMSVLLNNGDGTFAAGSLYPAGSNPRALEIVELSGDTYPDIALTNFVSNNVSIFIGNGDGTFASDVVYATGQGPTPICSDDFDGDSKNDLAVANFTDNTVSILLNGSDILVGVDDNIQSGVLPSGAHLRQNYPNPFNPETSIEFSLPERAYVSVVVYNTLGQRVRGLVGSELAAGDHVISWDGCDDAGTRVAGGLYLYRLKTDDFTENRKMLLLK